MALRAKAVRAYRTVAKVCAPRLCERIETIAKAFRTKAARAYRTIAKALGAKALHYRASRPGGHGYDWRYLSAAQVAKW